jgi:hypothetical protein
MEMVPQNIVWRIPEEIALCDLFLFFRGQFFQRVAANNPLSYLFFEKLARAKVNYIYVKQGDLPAWNTWQEKRFFIAPTSTAIESKSPNQKSSTKRAELLSYLRKQIHSLAAGDKK